MLDCWFHFKNEIPINCLFTQWKWTYIGFWTLEMKCTQYGNCGEVAFKNARAMIFLKVGWGGQKFSDGSKKSRFLLGQLPPPKYTSPERLVEGRISSFVLLCGVSVYSDFLLSHQIWWVIKCHILWRWPVMKVIVIKHLIFDLHKNFCTFIEWIKVCVLGVHRWYGCHLWKYVNIYLFLLSWNRDYTLFKSKFWYICIVFDWFIYFY